MRTSAPYRPLPFRPGNTLVRRYQEAFVDAVGNHAVITKVDYRDKKGRLVEGYTLYVKWLPAAEVQAWRERQERQ